MDAQDLTPGQSVIVFSFGTHRGKYVGKGDHKGWVRVDLGDRLGIWHGTARDVEAI